METDQWQHQCWPPCRLTDKKGLMTNAGAASEWDGACTRGTWLRKSKGKRAVEKRCQRARFWDAGMCRCWSL